LLPFSRPFDCTLFGEDVMKLWYRICALVIAMAPVALLFSNSGAQAQMEAATLPVDGTLLYSTYCIDCHGKDATGHGPMATTLNAKVPDLTRLATRNGGAFPLHRVEKLLTLKTPPAVTHGGIEMPTWGLVFSGGGPDTGLAHARAHNIARYLESLQK
jgi:mono/diheme cytochrome c family protein